MGAALCYLVGVTCTATAGGVGGECSSLSEVELVIHSQINCILVSTCFARDVHPSINEKHKSCMLSFAIFALYRPDIAITVRHSGLRVPHQIFNNRAHLSRKVFCLAHSVPRNELQGGRRLNTQPLGIVIVGHNVPSNVLDQRYHLNLNKGQEK